jgi:hypothetical protein
MSSKPRVPSRAVLVLAMLAGLLALGAVPPAVAVTSHRALDDTRPVVAGPVRVDFPIEYFGLVADLPSRASHLPDRGPAPYGEARFRVDGRWTGWRPLEQDGAQEPGHFTAALLDVDRADAYQVRGVPAGARHWRAAAINTTDGASFVTGHRPANAATAAPRCMSRADWGADESISGWAHGDQQTFSPVQTLTVHHTAGSNDPDQDYAATVRAIYAYHVKTNGWSDIGYQYLVDGHGTVYEGRSTGRTSTSCLSGGGDGSDFAHLPGTDDVVTGAHVGGWNTGNVGISMMGCFEPTSDTCTGTTSPSDAAVDALESELALLSLRHHLDPQGTVHYVSPGDPTRTKDVPTISGHRDWNSTACPGGNLYARLPGIRANVASRVAGTTPMDSAVLAFSRASRAVAENGGVVNVPVHRSGNTSLATSVDYARTSGSASPDADFTLAPGTLTFAAGETTKTIPVTIGDDAAREGGESIVISLRDPGQSTVLGDPSTTTVTIAPSDQRPDALVKAAGVPGYLGNNVYNTSGHHQTKKVTARRTATRTFYVRVSNDGNVRNAFAVTGSAARAGSRVRYYSGATDITSAMRSTGGWKVRLAPGAYKVVTVKVKVGRRASIGSLKPATVRATWFGDGARVDVAKGVVKVVR